MPITVGRKMAEIFHDTIIITFLNSVYSLLKVSFLISLRKLWVFLQWLKIFKEDEVNLRGGWRGGGEGGSLPNSRIWGTRITSSREVISIPLKKLRAAWEAGGRGWVNTIKLTITKESVTLSSFSFEVSFCVGQIEVLEDKTPDSLTHLTLPSLPRTQFKK